MVRRLEQEHRTFSDIRREGDTGYPPIPRKDPVIVDPVRQYLNDIETIPLLTNDQVVFLSQQIERGRLAKTILHLTKKESDDTSHLPLVGQKGSARILKENALQYLEELGLSTEDVEFVVKEDIIKINKGSGKYVARQQEELSSNESRVTVEAVRIKDPNSIQNEVGFQVLEAQVQQAIDARQKLSESNLKLVVPIAKKYANRQNPILDLIQEGNLELLTITQKYEWWKNYQFSTYATNSIDGHIRNSIKSSRLIRISGRVTDRFNRILAQRKKLEQTKGAEPTIEELAEATGMGTEKLQEILSLIRITNALSLEMPLTDNKGDKYTLEDFVTTQQDSVGEEVVKKMQLAAVENVIAVLLTKREIQVLQLRFGLEMTQEKAAGEIGVTRERVGKLERTALKKLKKPENRKKLEDWI